MSSKSMHFTCHYVFVVKKSCRRKETLQQGLVRKKETLQQQNLWR